MAVPARPSTSTGVPAAQSAVADASQSSDVLRAEPNDPFWLVVYPNSPTGWNVETRGVDEPTYLPSVCVMPLVEGANGIRSTGPGEDKARGFDGARNKLAIEGAITIPPDRYLLKTACTGGFFYHTPWQVLRQPLAGQRMVPKVDHDLYAAFRLALVDDGIVPPPNDQIIAYLEAQADDRVSSVTASTANEIADIRDPRIAKARARRDQITSARRPWEAPAPKAVAEKPKRGKPAAEDANV